MTETMRTLKDGTEVLIREMTHDDLDRSVEFFVALPEEDRTFLRRPLTDRDSVRKRIMAMDDGGVRRLVAMVGTEIVADGALELDTDGWAEHIGEIRLIVARGYQGKGLAKVMAFELYKLANQHKVEEVVVKIMGPQTGVQKMFERLGFHPQAEYRDYVKDIKGGVHDLIVMRCKLQELWDKAEDQMAMGDWQRRR